MGKEAGAATALSQGIAFSVGLVLVLPHLISAGSPGRGLLHPAVWRRLWSANRDIMIRTLTLVGAFATFTDFSAVFGTVILAANAILIRVLEVASWLIDGMAFATETLVGEAHGRGDTAERRRILKLSLWAGVGTGVALATSFAAAPELLLPLLTDQAHVLPTANRYSFWLLPVLGVGSAAYILDGYYLGVTETRHLRNAAVLSTAVGFLPLAIVARWLESPTLLWAAMSTFMLCRVATLASGVPRTFNQPK